jgi:hypothetical protein
VSRGSFSARKLSSMRDFEILDATAQAELLRRRELGVEAVS